MGLARLDPSSDYAIFFAGLFILLIIIIVALERASPTRKRSRRHIRRGHGDKAGELID